MLQVSDLRLQAWERFDHTAVSCLPKGNHYEGTTKSEEVVQDGREMLTDSKLHLK